jgi:16S rRNA processing protein RimM
MNKNCVEIGAIVQTRGLKGYVVARIEVALETFDSIKYIFVKIKHTLVPYQIEDIIEQGQRALIKFQYINDQAAARALIGTSIYLPQEVLDTIIEQEEDSINIIGYQVTDAKEGELGIVRNIEQFPLHACLVIDYLNKELLIPYEAALIQHLDHEQKQILVILPAGFLEAVGYK